MAYELYNVLEVLPQASSDELKRAYYRLVRKHSPEKDPERFKQIREAYETLSDPKARKNYNSLEEYGDQIQDLLDQAGEKMQAEEWSNAISLLKRVLVLVPEADTARNRLGICYTHDSQWEPAVKVYQTLTKDDPDVPLYWSNFGQVYKQQANFLDDTDYNKSLLYEKARKCFEKAVVLESFNSENYLEIAQTYLDENNYSQALAWAERAISADGKADFHDFDSLFFICIVYVHSDELENIELTVQRIISLLPDSEDSRRYAAYKFYNFGIDLAKSGANKASVRLLKAAFTFFKAARDFDPSDADIKDMHEKTKKMVAALEQYEILKQDSQIINGLQRLAAFFLADALNMHNLEQKRDDLLNEILKEISASSGSSITSSVRRIKSHYPAVYALNEGIFDSIEEAVKGVNPQNSSSLPPPPPPPLSRSDNNQTTQSQQYSNRTTSGSPSSNQTSISPSASNDWRNAVIIGSLIGGAIIIGLALTRSPQPIGTITPVGNNSTSSNSSSSVPSLSQQDAKDLIAKWLAVKQRLFASPYDQELGTELTTGKAYKDNIKGPTSTGEAESSLEWLRNHNSYYTFGIQKIDSVERFESDVNQAVIEVFITEERTLYNNRGGIDKEATGLDTRLVRYSLQLADGKWKIVDYKTIRKIR